MSKYQDLVETKVKKLFSLPHFRFKTNYRPVFLKNEITGYNFELDVCVFLHEINGKKVKSTNRPLIAFEIQGEQHFKDVKKFSNDSDLNKYRDTFKFNKCKDLGIPLIEIFYTEINDNLNVFQKILDQKQTLNHKQKKKINHIIEILNYDPKKHPDIDKWLRWHEVRIKPKHTYSKKRKKLIKRKKFINHKPKVDFITLSAWVDFLKC